MNRNQFYRIIIFIFIYIFVNSTILQARIEKPKGKENRIKLKIKDKERTYYELDKDGLNYVSVGKKFEKGDSIKIGIFSRTIKPQTGKKVRNYGFRIQVDNNPPKIIKYKKTGSNVTSPDRPGWNYTQSGVWYIYLPVKDKGYKIKIMPLKGNSVVYIRMSTNELKKKGSFGDIVKTVNRQDRWRIETQKDKDKTTTYWYPLKKNNKLQYELNGPMSIKIFTRVEFNDNKTKDNYYLRIKEDGYDLGSFYFSTEKSTKSLISKTGNSVGKWRSIWLNIPKGKHYYTFTLPEIDDNSTKRVFVRLKEWQK